MTIRVAVIGAGYFAGFHINAWLRIAEVQLIAIVEQDETKHDAIKTVLDAARSPKTLVIDSLNSLSIGRVDLIDIATPPHTHAALIQSCIELQCSTIICQKPFCDNPSTATEICKCINASNTTVVVHENFRFQPWYRHIKKLLNENLIGQVLHTSFRLRPGDGQGQDAYLERQPYFRDMEKFLIHETGIHYIDVFRYLFGEPQAVSAELNTLNPVIKGEDSGHFIFYYKNGLRAHFDGNRLLDHAADNTRLTMGEMLIEGTEGSIKLLGNGELMQRKRTEYTWHPVPYPFEDKDFGGDCVYSLQKHVIEYLQNKSPLENDAINYLRNLEIEQLIYTAAGEHRQLQVPEQNGSTT